MTVSSHWNFGLYACTCVCRCVHVEIRRQSQVSLPRCLPSFVCDRLLAWNIAKQARLASQWSPGMYLFTSHLDIPGIASVSHYVWLFLWVLELYPVPMFTRHMLYNWASSTAHTTRTWRLFPCHLPILSTKALETRAWPYCTMMFCIAALPPQIGPNTRCPAVSLATQGDRTGHLLWLLDTLPSCGRWWGYISTIYIPNLPNRTSL